MKRKKNDHRHGLMSRVRRFYEERPTIVALVVMGISITAFILGAYMRASATAG